jgi:thioredoxin 2
LNQLPAAQYQHKRISGAFFMSEPLIIVCPHCHAANRVSRERLTDGGTCGKCKGSLFAGEPLELDQTSFDTHAGRSDLPLVVDFWAPWCGPCRSMAPAFAQVAQALEPNYRLAKVNTEVEQNLATRFGIRSIPTIAVFKNGREIARQAGAMDAATLTRWIRSVA